MSTLDHRDAFRTQLEAALKADEQHLARFRYLLTITQSRLVSVSDSPFLWQPHPHIEMLERLIASSEATIALLRKTLEEIASAPDRQTVNTSSPKDNRPHLIQKLSTVADRLKVLTTRLLHRRRG